MTLETLQNALELLSPYFYADMGIYIVLGFSILGSAIGIFNTGATLVTATIAHPEIRSKNLLSILFCEAIALYGVIMSIIILTAVKQGAETSLKGDYVTKQEVLKAGYGYGAAGISVGFSNFAAAITVGVLGSSVAVSHCGDPSLFVKLFISEIFAEAIALIGLISGIVMTTSVSFEHGA